MENTKSKKRHNKKRNTGLLYEFLIRHASSCALDKNSKEMDKTLKIIKKYFQKGSPLNEELRLFKTLSKTNVKNRDTASKILKSICNESRKADARKLDEYKSKLIKEVNYTLNQDVYNYKIPNYTVYASAQMLFNDTRNKKKVLTEIDKLKLEETVSDFLLLEKSQKKEMPKKDGQMNRAVYSMLLKNYHETYASLKDAQKEFLMEYSQFLIKEDEEGLIKRVLKEARQIKEKLTNIKNEEILKDKQLMERINECKDKLTESKLDTSEDTITMILQYMTLASEIEG